MTIFEEQLQRELADVTAERDALLLRLAALHALSAPDLRGGEDGLVGGEHDPTALISECRIGGDRSRHVDDLIHESR